jgi:hypothetical protein
MAVRPAVVAPLPPAAPAAPAAPAPPPPSLPLQPLVDNTSAQASGTRCRVPNNRNGASVSSNTGRVEGVECCTSTDSTSSSRGKVGSSTTEAEGAAKALGPRPPLPSTPLQCDTQARARVEGSLAHRAASAPPAAAPTALATALAAAPAPGPRKRACRLPSARAEGEGRSRVGVASSTRTNTRSAATRMVEDRPGPPRPTDARAGLGSHHGTGVHSVQGRFMQHRGDAGGTAHGHCTWKMGQ